MSRAVFLATAAAALLAGAGACSAPMPRYAIVSDPLGSAMASAPTEPAPEAVVVDAVVPAAQAAAEPVAETPRAAPLGAVETVVLTQLPPVQDATSPSAIAPQTPPLATAPAATAPIQSAPPAVEPGLTHAVGPGDTFFAIARRYGVGPQAVAEVNGLTFASTLRLGQRVQLPAGARDRGPEAARSAVMPVAQTLSPPTAPAVAPPASAQPPVVQPQLAAPTPAPSPPAPSFPSAPAIAMPVPAVMPPPPPAAPVATQAGPLSGSAGALAGRGLFVWPLRGDLISGFGPKGMGQRSDGVNITAAEGDPVRAAASGTVVYAGDQVKGGFGKLVLIEHENRWFTAYAHLSDITVRMKDRVAQNQQIGRAGRTGAVGSPQLYFEVRHAPTPTERARPLDPLPLMPQ